jgi:hypothetical protein
MESNSSGTPCRRDGGKPGKLPGLGGPEGAQAMLLMFLSASVVSLFFNCTN